ncbi:ubiquinol-cytochrome-c reductase complex subunit (QCR10) domain-containing protein [Hirsutella rhossiliensis]|uniref:Ubiquinol-cytochrome-c reductase complex subunit (QCR10) domain-containing protein n=1 Tax=Hirsutella rhossiliensis TaxID=111463 RepID=A0A9P8N4M3_9HYPO|nr:ubiquinol-cytochrome-c reductase complex subunit (QCR10) domain-containing protein [Hirsutella rhossiliensis]KAH0966532.1 ubiquinol-cytochrome-c reductase complex subunit (QCR10) domain-containing protein [Hirsutella rhossiliensis]
MVSPTPFRAAEFRSAYGPKYQFQPNLNGMNKTALTRLGFRTAFFGGAAGVAALLFVSGIPRVRQDVLQKLPFVGNLFIKEEPPASDNPF